VPSSNKQRRPIILPAVLVLGVSAVDLVLAALTVYCVVKAIEIIYVIGVSGSPTGVRLPGGFEVTTWWPGLIFLFVGAFFGYLTCKLALGILAKITIL